MFGNDDQNQQPQDNPQAGQVTNPTDPNAGSGLNLSAPVDDGSAPTDKPAEGDASSAPILSNDAGSYIATDPPGITPPAEPAASSPTLPASDSESIDSAVSSLTPPMPAPDTPSSDIPAPSTTPAPVTTGSDDLLNIKQQALQQLSPLVGHLDQTPEEKFRTTMMMIQASDDQSLVKTAYEAAQQITDEKARAQALLDVVNEINYFTQHPQG